MKKLLALLLACTTLTCAFASCGDSDDDKDEKTTKSASTDDDEDDEDKDSDGDKDSEDNEDGNKDSDDKDDSKDDKKSEDDNDDDEDEKDDKDPDVSSDAVTPIASDIVGKWECYSIGEGDEVYEGEFMGIPLYALFQMELLDDGTGYITSAVADEDDNTEELSWKIDGDTIILTDIEDETIEGIFDGTYIILEEDGSFVTMKSVSSFSEFDYEAWLEEMMAAYEG